MGAKTKLKKGLFNEFEQVKQEPRVNLPNNFQNVRFGVGGDDSRPNSIYNKIYLI